VVMTLASYPSAPENVQSLSTTTGGPPAEGCV
jgi:hypothetical protein